MDRIDFLHGYQLNFFRKNSESDGKEKSFTSLNNWQGLQSLMREAYECTLSDEGCSATQS
jgi:hypothetical protein